MGSDDNLALFFSVFWNKRSIYDKIIMLIFNDVQRKRDLMAKDYIEVRGARSHVINLLLLQVCPGLVKVL